MIRAFFGIAVLTVLAAGSLAQVRQGGVYQIGSEILDGGGGAASGGNYRAEQSLGVPGGLSSGGVFAVAAGFIAQGGSGGSGSGPLAFAAWQTAIFGSPAGPGAGATEDPDGDGVSNLLEFAFNLPPLSAGVPLALPGATGGLPWIREEESGGDRYITMEFIQRKNAGLFLPETSENLSGWAPAPSVVLSGPEAVTPVYERVKLRVGGPIRPGAPTFHRLRALIQ